MTPDVDDTTATPPHGDPLHPHTPKDAGPRAADDSSKSANDSATANRGPDAERATDTSAEDDR